MRALAHRRRRVDKGAAAAASQLAWGDGGGHHRQRRQRLRLWRDMHGEWLCRRRRLRRWRLASSSPAAGRGARARAAPGQGGRVRADRLRGARAHDAAEQRRSTVCRRCAASARRLNHQRREKLLVDQPTGIVLEALSYQKPIYNFVADLELCTWEKSRGFFTSGRPPRGARAHRRMCRPPRRRRPLS